MRLRKRLSVVRRKWQLRLNGMRKGFEMQSLLLGM
jgi:hypothetical protein